MLRGPLPRDLVFFLHAMDDADSNDLKTP